MNIDDSKLSIQMANEPFFAFLARYENEVPENISGKIVSTIIRELSKYDEDVYALNQKISDKEIEIPIIAKIYQGDSLDSNDVLGQYVRNLFPYFKMLHAGLKVETDIYRCILVFTSIKNGSYWRFDSTEPKLNLPSEINKRNGLYPGISDRTDIRELLGNTVGHRVVTIISGSPGWDEKKASSDRSILVFNRNCGELPAVQNDFNMFLEILQRMTIDDFLPGITSASLVRTKESFLTLLECLKNPEALNNVNKDQLAKAGYSGAILKNSMLSGCSLMAGSVIIVEKSIIKVEPEISISERLIDSEYWPPGNFAPDRPYGVIYYAGHGSSDGKIQIERTKGISPIEVFQYSYEFKIPLAIILDMCYGHVFGTEYQNLLNKYKWQGIVLSANDGIDGRVFTFETEQLWRVKCIDIRTQINKSNNDRSRGVFNTAFARALMRLRTYEISKGNQQYITIRGFTENILRPICMWLHRDYGIPLIKPKLFGYIPSSVE